MNAFQAIILGIVQGLTEFLPISSSGHLILVPYILGWDLQDIEFDVALHMGTALAVLINFWREWIKMGENFWNDSLLGLKNKKLQYTTESKLLLTIIIVCVPVGLVGLLFEDTISSVFRSPYIVAFMMIAIAILMLMADKYNNKIDKNNQKNDIYKLSFMDSLVISLSQIIALIPGSSRSGSTISFGLFRNLTRETAAKMSFLIGTPIIIGAGLSQIGDIINLNPSEYMNYILGFFASFITGFLVIKWLLNYLKTKNLTVFIVYRILLAFMILFFLTVG